MISLMRQAQNSFVLTYSVERIRRKIIVEVLEASIHRPLGFLESCGHTISLCRSARRLHTEDLMVAPKGTLVEEPSWVEVTRRCRN
jgi:hypothetical protein